MTTGFHLTNYLDSMHFRYAVKSKKKQHVFAIYSFRAKGQTGILFLWRLQKSGQKQEGVFINGFKLSLLVQKPYFYTSFSSIIRYDKEQEQG